MFALLLKRFANFARIILVKIWVSHRYIRETGPNTHVYGPWFEHAFRRTARRPIRTQEVARLYNKLRLLSVKSFISPVLLTRFRYHITNERVCERILNDIKLLSFHNLFITQLRPGGWYNTVALKRFIEIINSLSLVYSSVCFFALTDLSKVLFFLEMLILAFTCKKFE